MTTFITGGAGFIGSNLLKALNDKNLNDILVVEELDRFEKKFNNLENMRFIDCIDKNKFLIIYPAILGFSFNLLTE